MKTKTVSKGVAVSIASGILLCDFSDMHEAIEFLTGEPVFTHQLAYESFVKFLAEAVYAQHPELRELSASIRENLDANPNARKEAAQSLIRELAKETVELRPAADFASKAQLLADSFSKPLAGKQVIGVLA